MVRLVPCLFAVCHFLSSAGLHIQGAETEWTVVSTEPAEWSDPGSWWRLDDGVIVAESKGGDSQPKLSHLQWRGSTGRDFELRLEYRITATSPQDAGIYFRVEAPFTADVGSLAGYQAELDTGIMYGRQGWVRQGKFFGHIHDARRKHMFKRSLVSTAHPDGRISTKPLPRKFVPGQVFRKTPEWNHCRVVAIGKHVQLFLNGVLANEIYDHDPKMRSTGDGIALQFRPDRAYRFEVRNLSYRPVPASRDTPPAAAEAAKAEPIVNLLPADDLHAFQIYTGNRRTAGDPRRVFKLDNGELLVSGNEDALLVTRRSFTNFHLRVEYRWESDDPGRNSGIYVNAQGPMHKLVAFECDLLGPEGGGGRGQTGELHLTGRGRRQLTVEGEVVRQGVVHSALRHSVENPVGEWNTAEILSDQATLLIKINGQESINGRFPTPASGRIMLQSKTGSIRFRRTQVVNIDAATIEAVRLAQQGKWSESARRFEAFFQRHDFAFDTGRGLWLATLYAATGDRAAHEEHCRAFFDKFSEPQIPPEGSRPAKAYVLLPGSNDPELLAKALEASRFSTEQSPQNPWYLLTRGMIEYRLGRYANVNRWLTKAIKSRNPMQQSPALSFSAMAEYRQGHVKRARQLLGQARQVAGRIETSDRMWNDVIGAQLAIDEATALLH